MRGAPAAKWHEAFSGVFSGFPTETWGSTHACFRLCSAAALFSWNACSGWGSIGHARVRVCWAAKGLSRALLGRRRRAVAVLLCGRRWPGPMYRVKDWVFLLD